MTPYEPYCSGGQGKKPRHASDELTEPVRANPAAAENNSRPKDVMTKTIAPAHGAECLATITASKDAKSGARIDHAIACALHRRAAGILSARTMPRTHPMSTAAG